MPSWWPKANPSVSARSNDSDTTQLSVDTVARVNLETVTF